MGSVIWRWQPKICKGFPHWALFYFFYYYLSFDNTQNFARGSPTEIFFIIYLFIFIATKKIQGVTSLSSFFPLFYLSFDNNQNISRGSPTEIFFFLFSYLSFDNHQNFAKGSPTDFFSFLISLLITTKTFQGVLPPRYLFLFNFLLITTKILQGVPPLSSFLFSLVNVVSVPLTEGNNRNFERGSPTELLFFK